MCGIAGIVSVSGHELPGSARHRVKTMTDKMKHRGPDGEGIWTDPGVCLGHRRLSIIDLAGGTQPMESADGKLCVVFNGEIYNFQSLREKLTGEGQKFRGQSDTEVILAAYARYGRDCVDWLEGMFAFALWDREKRTLFCARDHFGKKPFYYTIQKGLFAFASDLASLTTLRATAGFNFSLSPKALMRYLAYEYVPTPECVYKEVRVLEPASWLALENGGISGGRYWDLPWPEAVMPGDEEETAAELRTLMNNAVASRMISDVPLGIFLSGGIDSSIVAGLAAKNSPAPIRTFSIGFAEASYDESRYANIVAKAFHTDHHERVLSAKECAIELPGVVSRMDTPMADASCAPTWLLSGLARERVTVALGGDGADELWAGYEHYIGYRVAGWYNRLPAWIRNKIIEPLAGILPSSQGYVNPRLAVETFLRGAAAPDWLRVETMLTALGGEAQKKILSRDWLAAFAEPDDFLADQNLYAPTRERYDNWSPPDAASPLARAFYVYTRQFMLDDILVKVDRCSMLHSLEVRSPFLDKHVAEFVAKLPISCKLRGFKRKYLLKKAFANLLPPEILRRNKRGFQIPVAEWLRGELKPLLLELCSPARLASQGIFNPEAVRTLMERHFSGAEDLRKPLWTLLVLQIWLRETGATI
ncbi:MAG: asparagine synthase (glutamine-hydrolyzing) [Desulfovibrio sp.]|nr:asparagine synthase (glutamine-hydrolyzing) [Desulfovibrio sp.]